MIQIFRVALIVSLLLNISCLDNGIDCGSSSNLYIDVQGLSGANGTIGNGFFDFDTLGAEASVGFADFGIRVTPEVVYSSDATASQGGFRAFACSPPPPQPTEEITEIAVFSSSDYQQATSNKVFLAGDTLNSIIKIYEPYSGRIVGLADLFVDGNIAAAEEPFTLQLVSAPAKAVSHQFTVHYRLDNGEFYQFTTDPVMVTP